MDIEYIYYYPYDIEDIDTVDVNNHYILFGESNFYTIVMVYRELVNKYKGVNIEIKNIAYEKNKEYKYKENFNCGIFIRNKNNKKYFFISLCDKISSFYNSVNQDDINNCIEIFAKVGVHQDDAKYKPYKISQSEYLKYTPISHTPDKIYALEKIEENYRRYRIKNNRSVPKTPIFIGGLYGVRACLKDSKVIKFYNTQEKGRVIQGTFIDILNRYSINVDVNSVAEISTRSLEIMGLASALVRPKLTIQYHNPLIPNYHYMAIECDQSNIKELESGYKEAIEKLKKDEDLRIFISENGRKWYEENCFLENYIKIIVDRIDLHKLNTL